MNKIYHYTLPSGYLQGNPKNGYRIKTQTIIGGLERVQKMFPDRNWVIEKNEYDRWVILELMEK